ncbi:replication restart helicase PriA [Psychroflexus maritimus]|uniref:Replication restart protein PriA n=1 Tax=Psychroflexus maritimus TaxID=2714865 RepID=A0A967DYB6_9FLAO|nr:primosomal protein N' [Psychroflexus maritimus]NGZ88938.1 primosomal protein N' [Psychroflexus maritimus]
MSFFVDVILPLPLEQFFTYQTNEAEFDQAQVGLRVAVPFGKSKVYTGIIIKKHYQKPLHYETKFIEGIIDDLPIVTLNQLKLWTWVANYYLCPIGDVMRASIPSALLLESETIVEINTEIKIDLEELSDHEYLIVEALQQQKHLKLSEIAKIIDKKNVFSLVKKLSSKEIIKTQQQLYKKYQPKLATYLRVPSKFENQTFFEEQLEALSRAKKQKEVFLQFFKIQSQNKKPITSKTLEEKANTSRTVIKALIDKAYFEEYLIKQERVDFNQEKTRNRIQLANNQENALYEIQASFEEYEVSLFHGVTSSGKTEIYMKLIEAYLKEEKQVLYLLPEIALTTQLIKRLQAYFGNRAYVFHSKYSLNERVEIYQKVLTEKKACIVVGTRSAIFLPFKQLGLVIVDESHETNFKQQQPSPRYNAKDTAIILAQQFGAKTLLGTATPSLESLYNVQQKKFGYIRLDKRYGGILPPEINLIDLKDKRKRKRVKGHFSDTLIKAIQEKIEAGKQIILFQNRRGFSPILECNTCGHSPQCPNCDVSLTFHKFNNSLRCHYCSYQIAMQTKCLACSSTNQSTKGFGTEQIEMELQELFPDIQVGRMDLDTTRGKNAYEKIIGQFENLEIDILVGTQMVTKGLDFKNVGLVGVLSADSLLNYPDFRSYEKCFQLLVQVAGRAGRFGERGQVLIQTYNPYHQILQQVTTQDFKLMYKQQIYDRKVYNYPPFFRLIKFTLKSRDYNLVNEASDWFAKFLYHYFKEHVLGPEFPTISRLKNEYLKNIILKIPPKQSLDKTKKYIQLGKEKMNAIAKFRSLKIIIDVDPQ